MQLFDLHWNAEKSGKTMIPAEFVDIYLCDYLGITYTELEKQPSIWVERMVQWLNARYKTQMIRNKISNAKH